MRWGAMNRWCGAWVAQDIPASFQAPTKPGKYAFHCFHHPYMTGVLTVS